MKDDKYAPFLTKFNYNLIRLYQCSKSIKSSKRIFKKYIPIRLFYFSRKKMGCCGTKDDVKKSPPTTIVDSAEPIHQEDVDHEQEKQLAKAAAEQKLREEKEARRKSTSSWRPCLW